MRIKLDLLPEEAVALRDYLRQHQAIGPVDDANWRHLERAIDYLANVLSHELARGVATK